jgi:N-acetylated-alpha-linked acidic dipeptidase
MRTLHPPRPFIIRHAGAAIVLALAHTAYAADEAPHMIGFSDAHAKEQAAIEAKFDAQLRTDDQRAWMERMASAPNHVGSPHDKANAEFTLAQFREWGWDAHIETFEVLYPTPKKVALEMIAPEHFTAKLHEPEVARKSRATAPRGNPRTCSRPTMSLEPMAT